MTDRTRVSGWDVTVNPPRPMEVFIAGHVTPEHALHVAAAKGLCTDGCVNVMHQTVGLPRWHKPAYGKLKPAN